jgi:superfamily I DNA/RNA helicase
LLSVAVSDADGENDERRGTISVFNGPEPTVVLADTVEAEQRGVADFLRSAMKDGINPEEIGVFVRTREVMGRAREAVKLAGGTPFELTLHKEGPAGDVRIGIMHLAKGLEFKAIAVIGCDEDLLPLRSRIEAVADEVELDDVYATERQLFYVACTRARDRLLVSGIKPGSEFLQDMRSAGLEGHGV